MEGLQSQLDWSKKQTSYAWAKYYAECETTHGTDTATYYHLRSITTIEDPEIDEVIPPFVLEELTDLLKELKKKIDCPICLDVINAGDIGISKCGHKYCKTCLERLKTTTKKCAICRRKICK
jgi:hypothetical protein